MRIVILINPKLPVEHWKHGREYAEASHGFDTLMTNAEDKRGLAIALREAADILEAPTMPDIDLV